MWIAAAWAVGSITTSVLVLGNIKHIPPPLDQKWWERRRAAKRAAQAFSGVQVEGATAAGTTKKAPVPFAPVPKSAPPPKQPVAVEEMGLPELAEGELVFRPAIVSIESFGGLLYEEF